MDQELTRLEEYCIETGVLDLWPDAVLDTYKDGPYGPKKAYALATTASKSETDAERKAWQQACLDSQWVWAWETAVPTQFSLNGFGFRLYGTAQKLDDTYISTHWITALFLPVIPMTSYWMRDEGDESYVLGQVPRHPRWVWVPVGLWIGLFSLVFLGLIGARLKHNLYATLVVFNGYSHPVEVHVAGDVWEVPAGAPYLGSLRASGPESFDVYSGENLLAHHEVDLQPAAGRTVLFNPGARGILSVDHIAYTIADEIDSSEIPEGIVYVGVANIVDDIDYVVDTPPEEKSLSDGQVIINSTFTGIAGHPDQQIARLSSAPDLQRRYAEAFVAAGGSTSSILLYDLQMRETAGENLEQVCKQWLASYPSDIERHRVCQVRHAGTLEEQERHYRALAAANPTSGIHQYLYGRLLTDPVAQTAAFEQAATLSPNVGRIRLAVAYQHLSTNGDLDLVDAHIQAAASAEPDLATETVNLSLRVGLLREEPLDALRVRDNDPSPLTLIDLEEVRRDPSRYDAVRDAFLRKADTQQGLANPLGNLALAAGKLDHLREANAQGAGLELFLALSYGATQADVQVPISDTYPDRWAPFVWDLSVLQGSPRPELLAPLQAAQPALTEFLLNASNPSEKEVRAALNGVPVDFHGAVWAIFARRTNRPSMRKLARKWSLPAHAPWVP